MLDDFQPPSDPPVRSTECSAKTIQELAGQWKSRAHNAIIASQMTCSPRNVRKKERHRAETYMLCAAELEAVFSPNDQAQARPEQRKD